MQYREDQQGGERHRRDDAAHALRRSAARSSTVTASSTAAIAEAPQDVLALPRDQIFRRLLEIEQRDRSAGIGRELSRALPASRTPPSVTRPVQRSP